MLKKVLLTLCIFALTANIMVAKPEINVNGYVEGYYGANNITTGDDYQTWENSRYFSLNAPNQSQFGIGWAQINGSFTDDWYRGAIGLQTGDFPTSNFPFNGMLAQAYIGFKFTDNLWLDAGMFQTHIGGESLYSLDNWLSTYSMLTYVGPLYNTGAKATFTKEKFSLMLGVVNGNQFGTINDNNNSKSIISYFSFTNNDFFISYAGYYGNDEEGLPTDDEDGLLNTHNNVVVTISKVGPVDIKFQADVLTKADSYWDPEANSEDPEMALYYGVSAQAIAHLDPKFDLAARVSYFDATKYAGTYSYREREINSAGLGFTIGGTYKPADNAFLRLEARYLMFTDEALEDHEIFPHGEDADDASNSLIDGMLTFGYRFTFVK